MFWAQLYVCVYVKRVLAPAMRFDATHRVTTLNSLGQRFISNLILRYLATNVLDEARSTPKQGVVGLTVPYLIPTLVAVHRNNTAQWPRACKPGSASQAILVLTLRCAVEKAYLC